MKWDHRNYNSLTKAWGPLQTKGEVHLHGIFVSFFGKPKCTYDTARFCTDVGHLKGFYETVSRGQLRIGDVSTEAFTVSTRTVDEGKAYEEYFAHSLRCTSNFKPKTVFMFGLPGFDGWGMRNGYVVKFDVLSRNDTTLVHEFGHNLGLYHATRDGKDRGDLSDRMGATSGLIEFNAPNYVFLGWLDPATIITADETASYRLAPIEAANTEVTWPKVIKVPIDNNDFLYLSIRDRLGPYDSHGLPEEFIRAISVHRYNEGTPRKTELLGVVSVGTSFHYKNVLLSDIATLAGTITFSLSFVE